MTRGRLNAKANIAALTCQNYVVDQDLISDLAELGKMLDHADGAVFGRVNQLISRQPLLLEERTLADQDGQATGPALRYLRSLRQKCLAEPLGYPLGAGPLEGLWEQVWTGEISIGYAEQRAAAEVPALLTDVYALAVSAFAFEASRGGYWRRALDVERLLLAAARTLSRGTASRWVAEREWLEVAHSILTWLPHRGVYHDAVEAGRTCSPATLLVKVRRTGGWSCCGWGRCTSGLTQSTSPAATTTSGSACGISGWPRNWTDGNWPVLSSSTRRCPLRGRRWRSARITCGRRCRCFQARTRGFARRRWSRRCTGAACWATRSAARKF